MLRLCQFHEVASVAQLRRNIHSRDLLQSREHVSTRVEHNSGSSQYDLEAETQTGKDEGEEIISARQALASQPTGICLNISLCISQAQ